MIPVQLTEIVSDSQELLIEEFKKAKNVNAILKALAKQVQKLEDQTWQVMIGSLLENAVGEMQNMIGRLVGEPRAGRSDPDYKVALRIRIRVNRSRGRTIDVIDVLKMASLNDPKPIYRDVYSYDPVTGIYSTSFYMFAANLPGPVWVANMIKQAKAIGTRGVLAYSTSSADTTFSFGSVSDPTVGTSLGSVSDPTTGANLAAVSTL